MRKYEDFIKTTSSDGKDITIPYVVIEGKDTGKQAVITAGVHGAEYPPISAVLKFYNEVNPEEVSGTIKIVVCSDYPAFLGRTVFVCPVDGQNPNRHFPGKIEGGYTDQLDAVITENFIKGSSIHMDLHCGDMIESLTPFAEYPMGTEPDVQKLSREIALYYGTPNLIGCEIDKNRTGWCCHQASSLNGIPAALCEIGCHGKNNNEDIEAHLRGIKNVLRHFGFLSGNAVLPSDYEEFTIVDEMEVPCEGLCYLTIKPGDDITKGQIIGEMKDIFGHHKADIIAPSKGRVLYFTDCLSMYGDLYLGDIAVRK